MWPVEQGLQKLLPDTFDVRYFDYRDAADQWAAKPAIAACLADYVNEVSANNRRDGGDGKVYLIGHSMGGLATRFAADPASVPNPIPAAVIGGVVTFDTPHQGSPFGNTLLATIAQYVKGALKLSVPDQNSDAAKCLARHDAQRPLPPGCATPPYLPSGTRVSQIAATNTVRRTLFGFTLYDLTLNSDGVVAVDSSHGYLNSGPTGTASPKGAIGLPDVACTTTSDQTMKLLKAAVSGGNLAGGIIKAELQALGQLWYDNAVLDQINSGNVGPQLAVMLATALFVYPCGHSAMLGHPDALQAAADALSADIDANRTSPTIGAKPMTVENLRSAQLPEMFGVPAGPMTDGERTSDTGGHIYIADPQFSSNDPAPIFGDFTGDGVNDAAAFMEGSSGVGGTHGWIGLFTDGGKYIGSFDGSDVTQARMAQVSSLTFNSGKADVEWMAEDNADPFATTWHATLHSVAGTVVTDQLNMLSSQSGGQPVNWVDYTQPAAGGIYWHSPSGNISCDMGVIDARVICVIGQIDFTGPAGCPAGPIAALIDGTGSVTSTCGGDPPQLPDQPKTLDFGRSITNSGLACASTEQGMTCTEYPSHHGFTLSRSGLTTF